LLVSVVTFLGLIAKILKYRKASIDFVLIANAVDNGCNTIVTNINTQVIKINTHDRDKSIPSLSTAIFGNIYQS
jgi:hypothetical protein